MGLACMRGLVEKFGERIVNESLDIFEGYLERTNDMSDDANIRSLATKVLLTIFRRMGDPEYT